MGYTLGSCHTQTRHRFDYAVECLNTAGDEVPHGIQVFRFYDRDHVVGPGDAVRTPRCDRSCVSMSLVLPTEVSIRTYALVAIVNLRASTLA